MHLSCIMFIAYHNVKHASFMHPLLRVVNESEEVTVDQVPEREHPPVEVGFDICGSSEEPNIFTNQGKPRSIQPFLAVYKYFYHLSPIICALSNRKWLNTNCCMPTLIF